MFKNYFIVALRNLRKHKFYSILNISGLAGGITACLLIGLYIFDELSYDTFHRDYQNIYHVGLHVNFGGQEYKMAATCPPLAAEMLRSIPGVEQTTRINPWSLKNLVVRYDDKAFTETKAFYADANFFEFFSYHLLEGDRKTVLKEPNTVVLAKAASVKYFGEESPLGKIIIVGNEKKSFKVTGVAEQPPANTHIQYDILFSASSDIAMSKGGWGDLDGTYVYFRKDPNANLADIDSKFKDIVDQHVSPEIEEAFGVTLAEFKKRGGVFTFFSYPLSSNHLYHPEIDGLAPVGDIKYVYVIGVVGFFILVIACINFMNLSTARSADRAKEVGLRKTLGSPRSKLILQFLSESFINVLVAFFIAVACLYLALPYFNLLAGKVLSFATIFSPVVVALTVAVFFIVVLFAGSYPAFYLTAYNPVEVLKGNLRSGLKSKGIRRVLVVIQFTISIALMVGTMVVYNQLQYMQKKNVGFDKQNVIVLKNISLLGTNRKPFFEAMNNHSEIEKASYTDNVFPGMDRICILRALGTTKDIAFPCYFTDPNHLDVLKIGLAEGRFFSGENASDSTACIINETAARELGWKNPLDHKLTDIGYAPGEGLTVIGVVKDFNYESFKSRIKPIVILPLKTRYMNMLIRYKGSSSDAVAAIETLWKQFAPNEPFEHNFLDQNFDEAFREEQRLSQLFTTMSGVAIFIASLGLLGLAAFTAEQRSKEIGIRKVMGASVSSVTAMLIKEFMILVGISFVVASILSWFVLGEWLKSFAYRIELNISVFLIGGAIAALVAWGTITYHFLKAANSNPVDVLRSE